MKKEIRSFHFKQSVKFCFKQKVSLRFFKGIFCDVFFKREITYFLPLTNNTIREPCPVTCKPRCILVFGQRKKTTTTVREIDKARLDGTDRKILAIDGIQSPSGFNLALNEQDTKLTGQGSLAINRAL